MSRTVASAITSTARVAALYVHPLKSAAGIRVDELALDERGAVGDRRWVLAEANASANASQTGDMITARARTSSPTHKRHTRYLKGPTIGLSLTWRLKSKRA